jgi:hypothetical protein
MNSDTKLNVTFIVAATAIFVTALVAYQHQQNKKVKALEAQIKTMSEAVSAQTPSAAASEVSSSNPQNVATTTQQSDQAPVAQTANTPDQHIDQDNQEIQDLQERLADLKQENGSIDDQAGAYRTQVTANTDGQKLDIDGQISALKQQMNDLDQRIQKNMDQSANYQMPDVPLDVLRNQRLAMEQQIEQLNLQKRQTGAAGQQTAAIAVGEEAAEKEDVRAEQNEIQKRLMDLKADVAKWQSAKSNPQNQNGSQSLAQ